MSNQKKAIVLSSGGVDSTTCLAIAISRRGAENVSTLSCYYGQKHDKELECAEAIATHYGVNHYVVDLSSTMQFSNCSLLKRSTEQVVHESYADQIARNGEGKVSTYVPFRNGLLLSAVTALAMSIYPDEEVEIYIGAHSDDAAGWAYADCSGSFICAMEAAIGIGTYGKVFLVAPLVTMNKAEVVRTGLTLKVPYELTWSCYEGGDQPCGTCGTCIDRRKAFEANGITDPALRKVESKVKEGV